MKKIMTILVLALTAVSALAQSLPLRSGGEGLPFKGGEEFGFKLHYKWGIINSDVAYATMSVEDAVCDGRTAYTAKIFGQSSKFYDTFFKVREDFRSTFDESLLPMRFWRETNEGKWYCKNDAVYDWDSSRATFTIENSSLEEPKTKILSLSEGTCDITSMVYQMRNVDVAALQEGARYVGTMMLDGETFTMSLTYTGKEDFKDKLLGKVECLRFAVRLNAGETFDTKEDLVLLFTNDENRIPVRFEAPFKFGAVSGRLVSYKGLKYPGKYK